MLQYLKWSRLGPSLLIETVNKLLLHITMPFNITSSCHTLSMDSLTLADVHPCKHQLRNCSHFSSISCSLHSMHTLPSQVLHNLMSGICTEGKHKRYDKVKHFLLRLLLYFKYLQNKCLRLPQKDQIKLVI